MKVLLKRKHFICIGVISILVIALALGLVFGLKKRNDGRIAKGAVVANGAGCSDIGRDMLYAGGSAVDAAIATLLCEGVMLPQSMGIGGGFVATIYSRETKKAETLIARESAPLKATENMFVNKTVTGALAAAVPGELFGYWSMHQKYGKLPWKDLFQPTINLCKNGIKVSAFMHKALKQNEKTIFKEESMKEIFVSQHTGNIWEVGDMMFRPKLAKTLQVIADKGIGEMYNGGDIGKKLVEDIQKLGGIISEDDLHKYNATWDPPVVVNLHNNYKLYSTPLPSGGPVLAFILNIMSGYDDHVDTHLFWHRLIETFKHAYGQRTKLGDVHFEPSVAEVLKNLTDPEFIKAIRKKILDNTTFQHYEDYGAEFSNPEDHGTANMVVLDLNGDAVTVTSTVNTYFGGKVRSTQTGIILNDEMDDFSTPGTVNYYGIPASPVNFIKPQKRPLSSMSPSIIVDGNGDAKMLIGAAGGSMITTSVAQIILRYLDFNEPLHYSVQAKRIHHQLAPMMIQHETGFNQEILEYLRHLNHVLEDDPPNSFSAVTTIGLRDGYAEPVYDERRMGSISLVYNRNKMNH